MSAIDEVALRTEVQRRIDQKTKPLGSLGRLEQIAVQLGLIQGTTTPEVENAAIYVIAADHGIAWEGVSAYPQAVTAQMVANFLQGGAAINVFARLNGLRLKIIDAGVTTETAAHPLLLSRRAGSGTRSFLQEPAMTEDQCSGAIRIGGALMADAWNDGVRVIGLGEMGIGNTSSASVLASLSTGADLEQCVGRGAGLGDQGLANKLEILKRAVERHGCPAQPLDRLRVFGGFEIAMLTGALLEAARQRMVILVDGFIVSAALAVARDMEPTVLSCCIFSHRSAEPGHDVLLRHFEARPVLDLGLRLGEGTGAALAYPIIRAAAAFLNEMATFESANVSGKKSP